MSPQINPYGTSDEKKALQTKSNLFILGAMLCVFTPMLLASSLSGAMRDMLFILYMPGIVFWFIGLGYYSKSKGYPALMCLLGMLSILGLLVLLVLPDQWKAALKRESQTPLHPQPHGFTNYPR